MIAHRSRSREAIANMKQISIREGVVSPLPAEVRGDLAHALALTPLRRAALGSPRIPAARPCASGRSRGDARPHRPVPPDTVMELKKIIDILP